MSRSELTRRLVAHGKEIRVNGHLTFVKCLCKSCERLRTLPEYNQVAK